MFQLTRILKSNSFTLYDGSVRQKKVDKKLMLGIAEFLLNLHSFVLTKNRLINLVEIDPLASLTKL